MGQGRETAYIAQTLSISGVEGRPERRSYARGEKHCFERAGHGWPAPALQTEQDARVKQGIGSVQGSIHSASLKVCPR